MPNANTPQLICRARKLRRNMTDGEQRLWSELREFRRLYGIHARKQAPIGPYVVDFVIQTKKLVIEIDGEHHFFPDRMRRDAQRDAWLRSEGYRIIRINTGELADSFDGCIEEILGVLGLMEEAT
jgi:very-short-patch-repair endonuclease